MASSTSQNPSWFDDGPPDISESTRKLLATYSKIPDENIDQHCIDVRNKAYAVHPYPCIGQWRFLHLFIGQHPLYKSEILTRMRDEQQNYLDLGCCFAQDIRRLVADGVESRRCWASDLRLDFADIGFDLFRDRDQLKTTFIEADILNASDANKLNEYEGNFDIIGASSFFHLFCWDDQKRVAHRVIRLLRPNPGCLIVGRQTSSNSPGEFKRTDGRGSVYRHSAESWRRMWDEVSAELSDEKIRFEIQVDFLPVENAAKSNKPMDERNSDRQMMVFTIRTK